MQRWLPLRVSAIITACLLAYGLACFVFRLSQPYVLVVVGAVMAGTSGVSLIQVLLSGEKEENSKSKNEFKEIRKVNDWISYLKPKHNPSPATGQLQLSNFISEAVNVKPKSFDELVESIILRKLSDADVSLNVLVERSREGKWKIKDAKAKLKVSKAGSRGSTLESFFAPPEAARRRKG